MCEALALHSELKGKGWKVDTITSSKGPGEKDFLRPYRNSGAPWSAWPAA
jgi:hypothetical protein